MARQQKSSRKPGQRPKAAPRTAGEAEHRISDDGGEAKERLAQNVLRWIRVIAWAMGLTVASIELLNAPFDRLAETFDNSGLMKVGLVIFFFGWLWGATNDTQIQRIGYCVNPKEKVGVKEGLGIVAFLAVFMGLYVLHEELVWFQLVLLIFILVNTVTWRLVFDFTREMIDTSYAAFRGGDSESRGNCSLAKLLAVVQYMNGPWQRRRFLTLVILAALQLVLAILVARGMLAPIAGRFSIRGVSGAVLLGYAPGVLFILYVLISEVWMKIYRIKVFAELNAIDEIERNFIVSKRRDADLPQLHLAGPFDFSACRNKNYVGHGPVKWAIDTFIPG